MQIDALSLHYHHRPASFLLHVHSLRTLEKMGIPVWNVAPRIATVIAMAWLAMASANVQAQQPKTAPKAAPRRAAASMSPQLLASLRALATERGLSVPGILHSVGGGQPLFILSNRAQVAAKLTEAAAEGATYTPPAHARLDTVNVSCGDDDIGEVMHCLRVAVLDPKGLRIPALSYSAGPETYRNGFGARWTVHKVFATYPAAAMRNGFTVKFANDDGLEWTYDVTADEARDELLLQLPQVPPMTLEERLAERTKAEAAVDAERRRVAAIAAEEKRRSESARCEQEATRGAMAAVTGCAPSLAVCAATQLQKRWLPGCPNTPLEFRGSGGAPGGPPAKMAITCEAGELRVAVNAGAMVLEPDPHPVRIKWGEAEPVAEQWRVSPQDPAVAIASDAMAFTAQFRDQSRLAIEVHARGHVPWVLTFNIGAFAQRVDVRPLRELCGKV